MGRLVFFFDIESDGLHGKGFAYGAVLARVADNGEVEVLKKEAVVADVGITDEWVLKNVMPKLQEATVAGEMEVVEGVRELRDRFWSFLQEAKKEGAEVWSDCNWPVETNFLSDCVADDPDSRAWEGPYPLKDLATLLDVEVSRAEVSGMPYTHNPAQDAEASLHCLAKILSGQLEPSF